jgi:hypothetical protein
MTGSLSSVKKKQQKKKQLNIFLAPEIKGVALSSN